MSRFQMLSDSQWSLIEEMLPRLTGRKGAIRFPSVTRTHAVEFPRDTDDS